MFPLLIFSRYDLIYMGDINIIIWDMLNTILALPIEFKLRYDFSLPLLLICMKS